MYNSVNIDIFIEIPYLPVKVCPSKVQYSPSTMMMSPCSSDISTI